MAYISSYQIQEAHNSPYRAKELYGWLAMVLAPYEKVVLNEYVEVRRAYWHVVAALTVDVGDGYQIAAKIEEQIAALEQAATLSRRATAKRRAINTAIGDLHDILSDVNAIYAANHLG